VRSRKKKERNIREIEKYEMREKTKNLWHIRGVHNN
jgi:hypothetical protein